MPTTDIATPHELQPPANDRLTIRVTRDPLRVLHGFPISSDYVETFWLPQIGPSAVCLLRLIDRTTRHSPDRQIDLALTDLATMAGIPRTGSRNSTITRSIDRLVRFGAARWDNTTQTELTVWSHLATVPARAQARWPAWLLEAHTHMLSQRRAG